LRRAALLAGGANALADKLDVPGYCVDAWIRERQPIPMRIFFRLVDLLVESDMKALRESASAEHDAPD
jgi:hypothetical protein